MKYINKMILIVLLLMVAHNSNASLLNDTVETIKIFEGYSATPYRDSVGVYTIGHGLTTLNGVKVTKNTTATPSQLKSGMIKHIKKDLQCLNTIKGFKSLNNNQKRAILSLAITWALTL